MAKPRNDQAPPADQAPIDATERMARAWDFFERGDKLSARREAEAVLVEAGAPEHLTAEARELMKRIALPRIAVVMASLVAGLAILLILFTVART